MLEGGWQRNSLPGRLLALHRLSPRYGNPIKWTSIKQRALFSLPFPGVMGRGADLAFKSLSSFFVKSPQINSEYTKAVF